MISGSLPGACDDLPGNAGARLAAAKTGRPAPRLCGGARAFELGRSARFCLFPRESSLLQTFPWPTVRQAIDYTVRLSSACFGTACFPPASHPRRIPRAPWNWQHTCRWVYCLFMYREITRCRVCGNTALDPILDLGMLAFTGIFPKSADQLVPSAPLQLVKCREGVDGEACGLVQLKHSCEASVMYGANYGYRSGLNQSMVKHLHTKAAAIKAFRPLRQGDLVLDIGSNDGTLLKAFDAPGVELLGMDPTGVKFREFYPPHIAGCRLFLCGGISPALRRPEGCGDYLHRDVL